MKVQLYRNPCSKQTFYGAELCAGGRSSRRWKMVIVGTPFQLSRALPSMRYAARKMRVQDAKAWARAFVPSFYLWCEKDKAHES